MDGAMSALCALAPQAPGLLDLARAGGAALLGERNVPADPPAKRPLRRRGRRTASGGGRLLRARDGWLAVNLPRGPEDEHLLPAWLETEGTPEDPWSQLERVLPERRVALWLERARWLGLAVAGARRPGAIEPRWCRVQRLREPGPARSVQADLRVLDLSSLWAGPLCSRLLGLAGGRVVKVESRGRPDGARQGSPLFFERMNGAKEQVALDLPQPSAVALLRELLEEADIVVESSRPRALAQMGIDAAAWVAARPGRTWVALSGYGRREPQAQWVAFGDDAAAAAGLCWCVPPAHAPLFVGDATADPVAGLHAALAALAAWRHGGGVLLDVPLAACVARCLWRGR